MKKLQEAARGELQNIASRSGNLANSIAERMFNSLNMFSPNAGFNNDSIDEIESSFDESESIEPLAKNSTIPDLPKITYTNPDRFEERTKLDQITSKSKESIQFPQKQQDPHKNSLASLQPDSKGKSNNSIGSIEQQRNSPQINNMPYNDESANISIVDDTEYNIVEHSDQKHRELIGDIPTVKSLQIKNKSLVFLNPDESNQRSGGDGIKQSSRSQLDDKQLSIQKKEDDRIKSSSRSHLINKQLSIQKKEDDKIKNSSRSPLDDKQLSIQKNDSNKINSSRRSHPDDKKLSVSQHHELSQISATISSSDFTVSNSEDLHSPRKQLI